MHEDLHADLRPNKQGIGESAGGRALRALLHAPYPSECLRQAHRERALFVCASGKEQQQCSNEVGIALHA